MRDSIINILANDNYIIVNKSLIRIIGLKESILLGELASEYNYYNSNNMLDEEGYFYSTIDNIEKSTSLSKYEQKNALDNLTSRNIVDVKIKGMPATRHIKLNSEQIISLFANNLTSSCQKTSKLDGEFFTTKNNNKNNNKNNSSSIYDFIETNFSRTLNPIELEIVKQWDDTELTRYAIKQAVLNLKYNIKYIDKILYQYELKNITTVAQAQDDEVRFKLQNEKKYKRRETESERLDRLAREYDEKKERGEI